jgi:hypothetical protein
MKVIVAFRNLAKAPKKWEKCLSIEGKMY